MNIFLSRIKQTGFLIPSGLLGYLWLKGHQTGIPGLSCIMRSTTGIPCPTCYLTRATSSALVGDITQSFQFHAFGPLVAILLVLWALGSLHQRRLVPKNLPQLPLKSITGIIILYWLLRLAATSWWPPLKILHFPG